MTPVNSKNNKIADQFKVWLFPALVTLLATIIYREVLEIRADVKQLLAQSNIDKTKIENLEKDVIMLNQSVFNKKVTAYLEDNTSDENKKSPKKENLFRNVYFKPEEEYEIKKYLKIS